MKKEIYTPKKSMKKFIGKPYSQFPVPVCYRTHQKQPFRNRNPGLININRTVNHDHYESYSELGQSQLIRKLGHNYQKQLQKLYNNQSHSKHSRKRFNYSSSTCYRNKNQEQEMKNWYRERTETLQNYYQQYMSKLQKELGGNNLSCDQRGLLFSQLNKAWQQQIPLKVKQCFEA